MLISRWRQGCFSFSRPVALSGSFRFYRFGPVGPKQRFVAPCLAPSCLFQFGW